ncbi:MAG: chemotaxis protein CheW [Oscillospiraceae bacterium]
MYNVSQESTEKNLWLLIKLKNQLYGINSSYVESILQLENNITPLPGSDEISPGIINIRGNIVPLLDLRVFMSLKSLSQEEAEFDEMLEQRKHDHIHWVDELERCIEENDEFHLSMDAHGCALGKWYDNYKTDNQAITFVLGKIYEPHKKLHETAHDALSCKRLCNECKRKECLRVALQRDARTYMHSVVNLLDEAKLVFAESYKKMCIVISNGMSTKGILVDGVVAVEELGKLVKSEGLNSDRTDIMIPYIAQRKSDKEQVLIINEDRLF